MKGVIVVAMKEMVQEKFGADKWEQALDRVGVPSSPIEGTSMTRATADVDTPIGEDKVLIRFT